MPYMRRARAERKEKDASGYTEIHIRYEATSSPREMLEHVVIQANSILKTLAVQEKAMLSAEAQGSDLQEPAKKKLKIDKANSTKAADKGDLAEFWWVDISRLSGMSID